MQLLLTRSVYFDIPSNCSPVATYLLHEVDIVLSGRTFLPNPQRLKRLPAPFATVTTSGRDDLRVPPGQQHY